MTTDLLKKKKLLKPGEKIRLCYDECFKIMFANQEHLEPLTLLLSKILEVDYEEIDGKIELLPLSIPKEVIGEKKTERDILVKVRESDIGKIILEVNFRKDFYETVINRNINYLSEVASKGLRDGDSYDMIIPTLLVNFNTFYVDNIHKKVFDYYYWMNDEHNILTENQKILNINIAECYREWYNDTYKAPKNDYEKNLFLLSALMYTDKKDEFNQIIKELSINKEIKSIIKEVSSRMTEDEVLTVRYVDFLEENRKINRSILNAEKKKARKIGLEEGKKKGIAMGIIEGKIEGKIEGRAEAKRELILNMYYNGQSTEEISKNCNLNIEEVKKIVNSMEK